MESQLLNLSPAVSWEEVQVEDEALGDRVAMNLVTKGTRDHPREQA